MNDDTRMHLYSGLSFPTGVIPRQINLAYFLRFTNFISSRQWLGSAVCFPRPSRGWKTRRGLRVEFSPIEELSCQYQMQFGGHFGVVEFCKKWQHRWSDGQSNVAMDVVPIHSFHASCDLAENYLVCKYCASLVFALVSIKSTQPSYLGCWWP